MVAKVILTHLGTPLYIFISHLVYKIFSNLDPFSLFFSYLTPAWMFIHFKSLKELRQIGTDGNCSCLTNKSYSALKKMSSWFKRSKKKKIAFQGCKTLYSSSCLEFLFFFFTCNQLSFFIVGDICPPHLTVVPTMYGKVCFS